MERRNTEISDLICSECGNIMSIPRYKNDRRERFHIKDMYCFNCNKITKYIEIGDIDIYKKKLEFKDKFTEQEQLVYDLLSINDKQRIK